MSDIRSLQVLRNSSSRGMWHEFFDHRQHVMSCLRHTPGGRLLLLGAGNCNDVDLGDLAREFDQVHLCDIDRQAMELAVQRVPGELADRILLHDVDLSGIAMQLSQFDQEAGHDVDTLIHEALEPGRGITARFDVVASLCLLSQLIEQPVQALGSDHPRLIPLILAVRDAHLRQLAESVADGGSGYLITDVVSETTVPKLGSYSGQDLPKLLKSLLRDRNFFTGVNPLILSKQIQNHDLCTGTRDVALLEPWLWDQGDRRFLVCAIHFRKDE